MRTLHQWPDSFSLETAKINLIEGAQDWFSLRRREFTNWTTFQQAFRTSYVIEESKSDKWERMKKREQSKDEKISTYFYAKVKLCVQLNLSMIETKRQILIGLWSKDTCLAMSSRIHDNADCLLWDIVEFERQNELRVERIKGSRSIQPSTTKDKTKNTQLQPQKTNSHPSTSTTINDKSSQQNADKRPPVKNDQGEWKCYNCS